MTRFFCAQQKTIQVTNLKTHFMLRVNIKFRKVSGERSSIYLEIVERGNRTREALDLFLYDKPRT
ncbi:MAG: hypothetical protein ACO28K_07970, partial [Bacteroidia bacterium]